MTGTFSTRNKYDHCRWYFSIAKVYLWNLKSFVLKFLATAMPLLEKYVSYNNAHNNVALFDVPV